MNMNFFEVKAFAFDRKNKVINSVETTVGAENLAHAEDLIRRQLTFNGRLRAERVEVTATPTSVDPTRARR